MKKTLLQFSITIASLFSLGAFAQDNPYQESLLESPIYKAVILGVQAEMSATECVLRRMSVGVNPSTNVNEFLSSTFCYTYNEGEREFAVDVMVNGVAADSGAVITNIEINRAE